MTHLIIYEIVPILKDEEEHISGNEMLSRAAKLGIDTGKKDADYLLAHQDRISKEWKDYCLAFPGYLDAVGGFGRVACLRWDGRRWVLIFNWLGGAFGRHGRVALTPRSN